MKKAIVLLLFCLPFSIFGQAPNGLSFQAVVRNTEGEVISNQQIQVRLSILKGSNSGPTVYSEIHSPTTNESGLFSLTIGQGIPITGLFQDIDWSGGVLYLKREIDPNNNGLYPITGTTQFLTTPYSFYSNVADSSRIARFSMVADSVIKKQQLSISNDTIYLSGGGSIKLPASNGFDGDYNNLSNKPTIPSNTSQLTNDAGFLTSEVDGSVTNEIQVLSISNDTIYLSDGGFAKLPDTIQDGTNNGQILYWNNDSWLNLPNGLPGQQLIIDENGLPKWTGDAYPTVSTVSTSSITATSVSVNVNIASDGGQSVSSRGVVYGISDNPTLSNSSQVGGSGTGSFNVTINELTPNTTYYVRGFGTNYVGTGYGASISFTTTAPTIPILSTDSITSINQISAISGGVISSTGGSKISARGVVWSTSSNPTIEDNKTNIDTESDNFNSMLTGLSANTTYYVKSYATNITGTGYGNQRSFTTSSTANTTATVILDSVGSIGTTSSTAYANVINEGGSPVTERGFVWHTSSSPTVNNNRFSEGSGIGEYQKQLSGLQSDVTYFVSAYAVNSFGISYSNSISLTTITSLASLITNTVFTTSETAVSGGTILDNGGSSISVRGVVWDTHPNPTISNNKTSDGNGNGSFSSYIFGLAPNTTYFLRAYATNNVGTAYGNELTFTTTTTPTTITDIDGNVYNTIEIGTQVWMAENLKTRRYRTGSEIPYVLDNFEWENKTSGAWSYLNHDENNNRIYGKLYNAYAIEGDSICPSGWHVPNNGEWTILREFLGGFNVAGGKMKTAGTLYWEAPNIGATNESGFSGLPGETRWYSGSFTFISYGTWWSSTPYYFNGNPDQVGATQMWLNYNNSNLGATGVSLSFGSSIRCIKD